MNRNQAQKRISDGLAVHAYSLTHQKRYQLRSIGLAICHTTCGRELTNRRVEFGT
jgi:hypothetical protein